MNCLLKVMKIFIKINLKLQNIILFLFDSKYRVKLNANLFLVKKILFFKCLNLIYLK